MVYLGGAATCDRSLLASEQACEAAQGWPGDFASSGCPLRAGARRQSRRSLRDRPARDQRESVRDEGDPGWLLLGTFVLMLPLVNPYIRGDGNGYYAYVRSAVIDGDLRFENEYRRGEPAFVESVIGSDGRVSASLIAGDGYVRNQWAVGPSMLWAPPFLLGHGVARSPECRRMADSCRWILAPLSLALCPRHCHLRVCRVDPRPRSGEAIREPRHCHGRDNRSLVRVAHAGVLYFLPFHVHALSAFAVALFPLVLAPNSSGPHGPPVGSVGSVGRSHGRGLLPQRGVPPDTGVGTDARDAPASGAGCPQPCLHPRASGCLRVQRGDGVAPALHHQVDHPWVAAQDRLRGSVLLGLAATLASRFRLGARDVSLDADAAAERGRTRPALATRPLARRRA